MSSAVCEESKQLNVQFIISVFLCFCLTHKCVDKIFYLLILPSSQIKGNDFEDNSTSQGVRSDDDSVVVLCSSA